MKKLIRVQTLINKRCFCWLAAIMLIFSVVPTHELFCQSYDLSPGNTWILDNGIFEPGTSTINEQGKSLENLGTYLAERPDLKVEVQGYSEKTSNEAAAKRISQARADALKAYLTRKFSIDPGRIRTVGYGSSFATGGEPAGNSSVASRCIQIVGLTPITQQPLTRFNRAADAVAYISLIEGDMQTNAPWDDDFVSARYQQQLFEGHKINVYLHGRSALSFLNGGKIEISENSRLILYGKTGISTVPDLILNRGTLRLDMRPLSGENECKIDVPGGQVTFFNSKAKVTVSKENNLQNIELCLFEGSATVAMNGGTIEVKEGYGVRVVGNEPPQSVQPLPETPEIHLPLNNQTVAAGKTTFSWKSETPNAELQFSKEIDFKTFVSRNPVPSTELTMMLDPGIYFWRVVPIDGSGLEGKPSEVRRIMVTSEVVTPSVMQGKISSVAKSEIKATLRLNCATDTTVDDPVYEIGGTVDFGSKVFINSWPIGSEVKNGSFSEQVQLFKGVNNFRVGVYALNGLENSQLVNVRYTARKKLRIGVSFMPFIPIALKNYRFGLGAQLNAFYRLSQRFAVKGGIGGAAIEVDSKAFGEPASNSEHKISSIFVADLGMVYDFLPRAKTIPYAEAALGFTSWFAGASVPPSYRVVNMFSPGIGVGVRLDSEQRMLDLGAYYRFLLDSKKKLDQDSQGNLHGLAEIRLTVWF